MTMNNKITFDRVISWDNMLEAYNNTQKGPPKHKKAAIEFKQNEIENLLVLRQEIIDGTYEHGPYTQFKVYEPKERTIFAPCYRDKIVHHMLYLVLRDYYELIFINDSYSCIRGKGNQRAVKRVQHYMRKIQWENPDNKTYVVKTDVSKFFPSIDRQILKTVLKKKIQCPKVLALLFYIIDSCPGTKGLPLGNVTSQILTNILMNEFDQYVKHTLRIRYYIRYADDMFFFVHDFEEADRVIYSTKYFIQDRLNLTLSNKKIIKRPIRKGIVGLGFKIFPTHILLTSKAKTRLKRKLSTIATRINAGENKNIINQELCSSVDFIRLSNSFNFLREIVSQYSFLVEKNNQLKIKEESA